MAVTDQQKIDFLLKKIGYTKTKTGSVVGTGAISGTPKQPFAEAIPSPLVVANSSLWNEADSIPATPPGSDTTQVKVYLAASSGLRMTADSTSSGQRAYIAYTTYNNTSSARLTNWIDTQFGAGYLIKVYKGDPNSGGVALSAAGSGANDGWFFDYSAGVLNFNDTSVPSGVTDTNIYIVGYRYIGQTGAPTSGISTFSYLDLTVERNLDVGVQGGISTFRNNIDLNADLDVDGHTNLDNVSIAGVTTTSGLLDINAGGQANTFKVEDLTDNRIVIAGTGGELEDSANLTFDGSTLALTGSQTISGDIDVDGHTNLDNVSVAGVSTFAGAIDLNADLDVDGHTNLDNISVAGVSTFTGDATFAGNVSIGGTLTYEDVINVDSVGIITARAGIRVTGGVIEALAGENKIPSLYSNMGNLPSAGSYHGMFAHVHSTGRGYFAHAGNWLELVNRETNGVVGTGTERYNIGPVDAVDINVSSSSTTKSLNVTGVATAVTLHVTGNIDADGDLDVDGHTNLDNVNIIGVTTTAGNILPQVDSAYDLGSSTHYWRNVYADNIVSTPGNGFIGPDLTVRNLKATGLSTFRDIDVDGHTNLDNVSVAGVTTFAGIIEGVAGENKIPSLYMNLGALPSPGSYHGMFAHVHSTGRGYFAHAGNWMELVNRETNGTVGTGTETYNVGSITGTFLEINGNVDFSGITEVYHLNTLGIATFTAPVDINSTLDVLGISTFNGNVDINADIDVDGHTNLDNVSIAGVVTATTFVGDGDFFHIDVDGHTDLDNVTVAGVSTFFEEVTVNAPIDLNSDLDVDGHTNLDNVSIAGVTTFAANARFNNRIEVHDGTTGSNGQYLKSIGTGVTWASFPTMRTRDTITASAGQQTFHFNYTVNFIDVFVNGIKLADSEFTATNGTAVVLSVGCFVGDIVELVSYNTVSAAGGGGGGGSLNNIVEDTSPQLGGDLDLFHKTINGTGGINMTGVVTATTFVGDGSGLTGIVGSGAGGVVIKDSGSVVGTAGTIDFGDNLSVSPINAGIVTITGSSNFSNLSVSGLSTFTGNIDANGDLDVDGHTNLDNVSVSGITTSALLDVGNLTNGRVAYVGSNSGRLVDSANLTFDGTSLFVSGINVVSGGTTSTFGPDVVTRNLEATGVSTFTGAITANGATFAGAIDANGDLDVDGHTELDNVNVSGVVTATTFKGAVQATSGSFTSTLDTVGINASGEINLDTHPARIKSSAGDLEIGVGTTSSFFITGGPYSAERFETTVDCCILYSAGTKVARTHNGRFEIGNNHAAMGIGATFGVTGNALFGGTGIVTATKFVGDGSELTGITAGISTSAGVVSIANDLDVDGHTYLDNVTIAGVATFSSVVHANEFSGALSANNLNAGTVPSARLSGTYNITNNGSAASIIPVNETSDTENFIIFTNTATGSQTPKSNTSLKFNASSGALTASSFVGDGSGLTGITASGTGIGIREDGNIVGTASTINFTEGVSVTPVSSGITTVGIDTSQLNLGKLNVSGISTFNDDVQIESSIKHIGDTGTSIGFPSNQVISFVTNGGTRLQVGPLGQVGTGGANYGTSGQVLTSSGTSGAVQWTTVNPNIGITTNITGSFGSSPGNPTNINTFGYGTDDKVVEYTVHFFTGSSMQTQKVLASRIGTTINYTNFAIHYNSSLLVQCDVIRSGGDNFVLRATPESGVGGTINYRIKREVM